MVKKVKTMKKYLALGIGALVIISTLAIVAATGGTRIIIGENENDNGSHTPTISSEDAGKIALDHVPGNITSIELENEDGFLVYGVHIQNADGNWDVKIDAGTGDLLKIDVDDGSEGVESE